jgi:hypothetical protein
MNSFIKTVVASFGAYELGDAIIYFFAVTVQLKNKIFTKH